jgi:hypothetical protein
VASVQIGRASYDTAPEGVAFAAGNVWANTFIWVGSVTQASSGFFGGGAAFTLNWSEYGSAIGVSTYREEAIKSNIVRASQFTAEKVVNANAGQLITTQFA